jgi:hypothetical protein
MLGSYPDSTPLQYGVVRQVKEIVERHLRTRVIAEWSAGLMYQSVRETLEQGVEMSMLPRDRPPLRYPHFNLSQQVHRQEVSTGARIAKITKTVLKSADINWSWRFKFPSGHHKINELYAVWLR